MKERIRLVAVAAAGAGIGFLTYELIFRLNPLTELRAPTSWLLSFAVGVMRQHALHRRFTFASTAPYWRSLGKAYRYYAVLALLGSAVDTALTTWGVPHRLAWLACLAMTATSGVLFLKKHVYTIDDEPV